MKTAVELITNSPNASVETKLLLLAVRVDILTDELNTLREQNRPIDSMPRYKYYNPNFEGSGTSVY